MHNNEIHRPWGTNPQQPIELERRSIIEVSDELLETDGANLARRKRVRASLCLRLK
jgi:hypothetical protein